MVVTGAKDPELAELAARSFARAISEVGVKPILRLLPFLWLVN